MHSPKPYGVSVHGGELSDQDRSFIDHEIKKLTNDKAVSKLDNIKRVKDLPDGGYVILQEMGGILKAMAYKESPINNKFDFDGIAKRYIPMFYSGIITKARVLPEEGVGIKITEQCRRRLTNYSNENLPPKELRLKRFVIKPNDKIVPEFIPQNNTGSLITTQYVQQRPTWYSGAMAEVMQIVGGYGLQNVKALTDLPLERAQLKIPEKYIERIALELEGIRLPGYNGVPPLDGEFQFDYKFHKTNGVTFDSKNQPWLTRINSSGVYAMPMPIVPATTTTAFREYVEDVGDEELLNILNRFGGMPSGEGFHTSNDFESWRRAGVVIKVCDSADFYSNIAYSPACGWSFNLRGTEGFNTCYSYGDDGIIRGKSYKIRLDFGSLEKRGWLNQVKTKPEYVKAISTYVAKLFQLLPLGEEKSKAIMYKLRRVDQEDVYQRALTSLYDPLGVTSNDVDYWDNLEVTPIANLNGNIAQVGIGPLYHNAKPKFQPQIKFPMVEMGGCISFDFGSFSTPVVKPNCDTIMYGYYVEDSLKVVKYFADWRSYIKKIESDYEPVMTVGSWQQVETTGSSSPQGYFYTTDFDFREVFSPVVTTTTIKGTDKGFDSKPFFSFDAFFWKPGTIWRNRYYTHLTKSNRTENEAINIAICIPYLMRNAAILAKKKSVASKSDSESLQLYAMQDPTSYRYWTYDFVFAWAGGLEKMTGVPYPKDGSPVWVEIENYNPSEYSDFADQGLWLPGLPYDATWLVHPNKNEWLHSGGGGAPKIKEYSVTTPSKGNVNGAVHFDISDTPNQVHSNVPHEWYFYASPDDEGNIFYRDACKVVFGNTEYANISETDQNNRRYKWGYSSLVEDKSAYHFIGVINE
ncbi:hypothetical protein ACG94X_02475 [Acinetobacter sp. ULE_I010]|uniref:hypothetical protein n=1 Tax=Acinetobacter sp. ULE_I010 TaxID=3373065 RepID=UPI003AF64182